MKAVFKSVLCLLLVAAGTMGTAQAQIAITEVDPTGSSTGSSSYNFDWFELTNLGSAPVNIDGWKMDDDSGNDSGSGHSAAAAVGLVVSNGGSTLLQPGQSVVFGESSSAGTALTAFVKAWFGGTAPAGFTFGTYSGSGVGLGSGGDAVNIFNAAGDWITGVTFGAASSTRTFDNAAGVTGAISTLSMAGINGAFAGTDGRVGSPGSISTVPLPAGIWLLGSGLGLLGAMRRRRAA